MYNEEVVKTADLQAHNVCTSTVLASLGKCLTSLLGLKLKRLGTTAL